MLRAASEVAQPWASATGEDSIRSEVASSTPPVQNAQWSQGSSCVASGELNAKPLEAVSPSMCF